MSAVNAVRVGSIGNTGSVGNVASTGRPSCPLILVLTIQQLMGSVREFLKALWGIPPCN